MRGRLLLAPLALLAACQAPVSAAPGEGPVLAPAARIEARESRGRKTAIFAGGCFWGIEAIFSHMRGVTSAVSGYHGDTAANADIHLIKYHGRDRTLLRRYNTNRETDTG